MSSKHIFTSGLIGALFLLRANCFAQAINNPVSYTQTTVPYSPGWYNPQLGFAGGIKINYVRTREALARFPDLGYEEFNGINDYHTVKEATQYIDGLGRPLQQISRQQTPGPTPKDMVTPFVYDQWGREQYKYMSYPSPLDDGRFRLEPFMEQQVLTSIYPGEAVFYSKTVFEHSPLNRVDKVYAVGNSWVGSESTADRSVGTQYLVNNSADDVHVWTITNNPLSLIGNDENTNIPTTSTQAVYGEGELVKNVFRDENGKYVVEYKDREGLLILKKVQVGDIAGDYSGYSNFLCTYYVYDEFNLLRFVIPPKALEAVRSTWLVSATTAKELCFRYEYDAKKRLIAKKVPGAGWVYSVYDKRDRLVFSQDAKMRAKAQWSTVLYDVMNRGVVTGVINYNGNRNQLQLVVDENTGNGDITLQGSISSPVNDIYIAERNFTNQPTAYSASASITFTGNFSTESTSEDFVAQTEAQSGSGYQLPVSDNPIPVGSVLIPLTFTTYDGYNTSSRALNTEDNGKLDFGANFNPDPVPFEAEWAVRGLATETKVRVLDNPDNLASGAWLSTTSFYDNRGRLLQIQEDNFKGGVDVTTYRHNFSGAVIATYKKHSNPASGAYVMRLKTNFEYDHAGRLLKIYKTTNDGTAKILIENNEYDLMGQLKKKELGAKKNPDGTYVSGAWPTPLETLDYEFNVRGWLKGVNVDYARKSGFYPEGKWFGFELSYDWGG